MEESLTSFTEQLFRHAEERERIFERDRQRENNSLEKKGFPRFVKLKNDGEKVRVITSIFGSGFFDLLVLRRNGEMFQIGITECVAFDDYVSYMFNQQDALVFPQNPHLTRLFGDYIEGSLIL